MTIHSPDERNLATLFEHQSNATPDAVAVVSKGPTTYRELANGMFYVDSLLRSHGVAAEAPVAVFMDRTPALVSTLLGILRAGAAYVPLDPTDPVERNRLILSQSGARIVLTDPALVADAPSDLAADLGATHFYPVDDPLSSAIKSPPPPPAPGGSRLAYLIFTSGSTGGPKGVAIEHRSVINLLEASRDLLAFTSNDRYLAASTIGFDISVAELFLPLITGASLLLRDRKIWLDPQLLIREIRRNGVTVLQSGPSAWSVLLSENSDFPRLRVAISTGEAIPPALAHKVASCADLVLNLYGPTEATVWATAHTLTTHDPDSDHAISAPIGLPIAGTEVLVLDDTGNATNNGEIGELCLGGPGLARGYYRNDALTGERFIHWGPGSDRFYRTGDLVSEAKDGSLRYHGRNDDQLQIRGVRLEPREVESTILRHPSVDEVAATWFESNDHSRALIAGVVLKPGASLRSTELHGWLTSRLPPQMIPSRFCFLGALPLSPAGKVDRNALRKESDGHVSQPSSTGARNLTATETALADIWKRLLKLESVTPECHFFSIGGDSLAAVRMVLEAESKLGVELSVQTVFESPTLGALASRLETSKSGSETSEKPRFVLPLTEISSVRPLFFNAVDFQMAKQERWRVPCPLYSVSHWAQGIGFLEADTVEELARQQIDGIREIQPSGPYRIAGYSFGGLVASEMAHQLQQAGEEIEFLFLLDPMQPYRIDGSSEVHTQEPEAYPERGSLTARLVRKLRILVTSPRRLPNFLAMRTVWHLENNPLAQRFIYRIVHLHGKKPNPVSFWLLPKNRWPAFWYGAQRMARTYAAHRFSGRVLAVFPEQGKRVTVWKGLLSSRASTVVVSASHNNMFEKPTADEWMDALTQFIHSGETPASGDAPGHGTGA